MSPGGGAPSLGTMTSKRRSPKPRREAEVRDRPPGNEGIRQAPPSPRGTGHLRTRRCLGGEPVRRADGTGRGGESAQETRQRCSRFPGQRTTSSWNRLTEGGGGGLSGGGTRHETKPHQPPHPPPTTRCQKSRRPAWVTGVSPARKQPSGHAHITGAARAGSCASGLLRPARPAASRRGELGKSRGASARPGFLWQSPAPSVTHDTPWGRKPPVKCADGAGRGAQGRGDKRIPGRSVLNEDTASLGEGGSRVIGRTPGSGSTSGATSGTCFCQGGTSVTTSPRGGLPVDQLCFVSVPFQGCPVQVSTRCVGWEKRRQPPSTPCVLPWTEFQRPDPLGKVFSRK